MKERCPCFVLGRTERGADQSERQQVGERERESERGGRESERESALERQRALARSLTGKREREKERESLIR